MNLNEDLDCEILYDDFLSTRYKEEEGSIFSLINGKNFNLFEETEKKNIFELSEIIIPENPIMTKKEPNEDNTIIINTKNQTNNSTKKTETKSKSNKTKLKKKRGRKSTPDPKAKTHTKYADDNLMRKCKGLLLNSVKDLINKNIEPPSDKKIIYKILVINHKQIHNSTINFNKYFLNKSIGDIFSDSVSTKYSGVTPEYNKERIKYLINNDKKKEFFKELFNLKFIDCLKHFRGDAYYSTLNGLTSFEEVKKNMKNKDSEEQYLEALTKYMKDYENKICGKNRQKQQK